MLTVLTLRSVLTSYYDRSWFTRLRAPIPAVVTALENDIIKDMTETEDRLVLSRGQTRALITFWRDNKDAFNEFPLEIEHELGPTIEILAMLEDVASRAQQEELLVWMNDKGISAKSVKAAFDMLKKHKLLSTKNVNELLSSNLTEPLFKQLSSVLSVITDNMRTSQNDLQDIFNLCMSDMRRAKTLASVLESLNNKGAFSTISRSLAANSVALILSHSEDIDNIVLLTNSLGGENYTSLNLRTIDYVLSREDKEYFGEIIQTFASLKIEHKNDITLEIFKLFFSYPQYCLNIRCTLEHINSKKTVDASDCTSIANTLTAKTADPAFIKNKDMTIVLVREWEAKRPVRQTVTLSQSAPADQGHQQQAVLLLA